MNIHLREFISLWLFQCRLWNLLWQLVVLQVTVEHCEVLDLCKTIRIRGHRIITHQTTTFLISTFLINPWLLPFKAS